jgi:hypothetical protein
MNMLKHLLWSLVVLLSIIGVSQLGYSPNTGYSGDTVITIIVLSIVLLIRMISPIIFYGTREIIFGKDRADRIVKIFKYIKINLPVDPFNRNQKGD